MNYTTNLVANILHMKLLTLDKLKQLHILISKTRNIFLHQYSRANRLALVKVGVVMENLTKKPVF